MANKPGDVDEAKADEANKAKANEADTEANETVEAIVPEEIKANESSSGRGRQAHEAGNAEVAEAYEAYEANGANKANAVKKPNKADEAKANEADEAEANEADKAIVADEIVTANDAAADKLPIDNEQVINSVIIYFSFG